METTEQLQDELMQFEAEVDAFAFADEVASSEKSSAWKVLVVDDDPQVHSVTKFALQDFIHQGRDLNLIHVHSSVEAKVALAEHPDVAIILLDVVMEEDDSGLKLVQYIRNELKNNHVRIVLRTGQPGLAPERTVIESYDIDDYKIKTEMTSEKLYTTIVGGLRAFKEIMRIEQVVEERTHEIQEINEELSMLNKDLLDSINYARRIQLSILPTIEEIHSYIPKFFTYYQPKDIVSGDFYWFSSSGDYVYFAAVDCTGHGVPGALMSVLSYSLLNQTMKDYPKLEPLGILNNVRELLLAALRKHHTEIMAIMNASADGMDIGLCRLHTKTLQMDFAGARRPLFLVKHNDPALQEFRGTRCSINPNEVGEFEQVTIQLERGDVCYLFTDGITDQFGGPFNRKYSNRRFRETIIEMQAKPFEQHQQLISTAVADWRGDNRQTDDLLVLGMKID